MYPIPPGEHLVENRTCKKCTAVFPITDKDMEFYTKVSPTFGGKKYVIPPPTFCPDCRQQRRLAFRNERKLYKRPCDVTGKEIVSCFSPISRVPVYNLDYWWSDSWDAMDYGRRIDTSFSVFYQLDTLFSSVPRRALMQGTSNINSEYVNCAGECKSSYYVFASMWAEDSYYSDRVSKSKKCVDCTNNPESEDCYEVNNGVNNFHCKYSQNIFNCSDCIGCYECEGCVHCIGCSNQKNKSFMINDKQFTKDDYFNKIKELDVGIYKGSLHKNIVHKGLNIVGSDNCIGDDIYNSSGVLHGFSIKDSNNIRYALYTYGGCTDMMDTFACINNSYLIYDSAVINKNSYQILFSYDCWGGSEKLIYCIECKSCVSCFGCIGLRNKSYCILNKQYTKEEYEELVPRIIEKMTSDGEWGEFFPASMSPFGYNETVASEYFPLKKEEAIKDGVFNWSDYEAPFPRVEKIIPASKLPDAIESIPDDILNWAIECEVSGKPFRIIRQELEFYRKHNLPIPRRHPDVRHMDRMKMRNPRKLYARVCDCERCEENWKRKKTDTVTDTEWSESFALNPDTGKRARKIITTYSPDRKEIVYCEVCYEREVVG